MPQFMLTLTGEKSNLLHHLPTTNNRTGFTTEELLETHVSSDSGPCCFGGVFDVLEVPGEKLGGRVPPSAKFAGVLLRKGNKLAGKRHGVMPLS